MEREEELVSLEEPAACILIDGIRVMVIEVLEAGFDFVSHYALGDGGEEKQHIRVERELVHWIHHPQIIENKIQNRRAEGCGPVCLCDVFGVKQGGVTLKSTGFEQKEEKAK